MIGRRLATLLVAALAVAACGADDATTTDGLVAHYPLDGDARDAAGDSEGVVDGATPAPDRNGDDGGALRFDGVDDLVTFEHTDALSLGNEFTISAWIDADEAANPDDFWTVFEKSDPERDGHSRYGLWLRGGRPWACFEASDNSQQPCVDSSEPIGDGWHHVAAVRSGRRLILYVDGVEAANGFVGLRDISQTGFEAFIGTDTYQAPAVWLAATVDELRIYDRGLSPDEVAGLAS
ncbi:MAG: LamG domain-containing protein [Actinomycetota bacterium]